MIVGPSVVNITYNSCPVPFMGIPIGCGTFMPGMSMWGFGFGCFNPFGYMSYASGAMLGNVLAQKLLKIC